MTNVARLASKCHFFTILTIRDETHSPCSRVTKIIFNLCTAYRDDSGKFSAKMQAVTMLHQVTVVESISKLIDDSINMNFHHHRAVTASRADDFIEIYSMREFLLAQQQKLERRNLFEHFINEFIIASELLFAKMNSIGRDLKGKYNDNS